MMDRRKYDSLTAEDKMDHILVQQERILAKHEEILKAFPYGVDHHKQEHIIREQARKDSEDFIKDLKRTLATKSVDFIKGVPHVQ